MFQLVCDPSGVVVETTIKELVPALVKWGNKLDHVLQTLLSHILGSVQVLVQLLELEWNCFSCSSNMLLYFSALSTSIGG